MIIKKKKGDIQQDTVLPEIQKTEIPITEEIKEDKVKEEVKEKQDEKIDLFDLDNIDFKQRQERRRGDRRRGFRRVDDRNLISRAREEAQSIKESAAKEGYQAGLAQAKDDIDEVKNAITAFLGAKQEIFDYIAPNVMQISLDIAKKIIKKEIQQDPSIILENISDILKGLSKEETKITLKVNPSQVSLLKVEVPTLISSNGLDARVFIVSDENIMEGGCVVETANGVIDASIETQLSVISEALKGI